VFSLLHPFAKTRHRFRRPRPYLQSIYLPTYQLTYLPTNQPTNQPIYLPTYTVDVVYARVELDARQQRTPSFIEPVLKKPLRLPLNPYPQPATIVSDVVLYYTCMLGRRSLFLFWVFFIIIIIPFRLGREDRGLYSVRFSGGEKAFNGGEGRGVGATMLHNNSCCCCCCC